MIMEGKTAEDIVDNSWWVNKTQLPNFFKRDYLIKALKMMLSTLGVATVGNQLLSENEGYRITPRKFGD